MNVSNHCNRFVLILFLALLLIPFSALAQICIEPETSEITEEIEDAFRCDKSLTGITFRLTECSKQILTNVAEEGFSQVLSGLNKAIFATLMMFVAFTGMKMILGGVRSPKAEALLMLLKLAFVAFIVQPSGDGVKQINTLVNGMASGMVDAVSSSLVSSGPCSTTVDSAGATIAEENVWKRVDCTILVFIGKQMNNNNKVIIADIDLDGSTDANGNFTIQDNEKGVIKEGPEADKYWPIDLNGDGIVEEHEKRVRKTPIGRGEKDLNCDGDTLDAGEQDAVLEDATLFEIGLTQLFTPHGIFILFLLIAAVAILFLAFAKVLQIYIIAFIAITFLMLFAPIFIPLMLFQKTKRMFQTWLFMIIGYTLQPALVIAFLSFFLAVMSVALHGQVSADVPPRVLAHGLKQSLDEMNKSMKVHECTVTTLATSGNAIMAGGADKVVENLKEFTKTKRKEIANITAPVTPVSYEVLSVFMVHLIGCVVLLFIMMGLFANIADFVASLSGGAGGNLSKMGGGMDQLGGIARDAARQITKD